MGYIEKTVKDFFRCMDEAAAQLQGFSHEVDTKRKAVEDLLHGFERVSVSLQDSTQESTGGVAEAMRAAKMSLHQSIAALHKKISCRDKATEFINRHEKYLVVMVFGAVKTGKSSLGNFLAGKDFLQCDLDTEYKHRSKPQFVIEESGRDSGEIVQDANGDCWFAEGITDTTGSMQYFTLSGLRWFDSPGTGAVRLEQDRRNMEEMVNEYLENTDLCVFLQNSSEPGLSEDMKYLEKLSRENQEALVAFTKSDISKARPVNGHIQRTFVAKDAATRKLQEDDVCQRIKAIYPQIDANKYRAISLSTYLAHAAIMENDEEKFKSSNLDKFMQILGDKASSDSLRLKQIRPKRQLNSFINYALDGDGDFGGLRSLHRTMDMVIEQVNDYKRQLDDKVKRLSMRACAKVKDDVYKKAMNWSRQVEGGSGEISANGIRIEVLAAMRRILAHELEMAIGEIIDSYEHHYMAVLPTEGIAISDIRKSCKQMECKYTEMVVEERAPSGFWENVGSFFGREYYETRRKERTKQFTVDLGTNVDSFLDAILPQVQKLAEQTVRKEMERVRDSYFAPQEAYAKRMKTELRQLESSLLALKYDIS